MTISIAALASGTGSNVAAVMDAIDAGKLNARMALVLSNNPEAPVLEKAAARGVPVWVKDHRECRGREAFDALMVEAIRASGADTIVLAGYMRILSAAFIQAFAGRIVNVHPAILPSFPGAKGGPDALAYGVRATGATVHFVDEIMDNGPVIIQAVVPVGCNDTTAELMPRIHKLEHRIFPQALQWMAEGRLSVEGRRVRLAPPASGACLPLASCGDGELGPWMVSPALEGF